MPVLENVKKIAEKVTGVGPPQHGGPLDWSRHAPAGSAVLPGRRQDACPLVVYRDVVLFRTRFDRAAIFEELFAANGWRNLLARRHLRFLAFPYADPRSPGHRAGQRPRAVQRRQGQDPDGGSDVIVLPAGTRHQRITASADLLVVGAYPADGRYDEPRPGEVDRVEARARIGRVPKPAGDPVYGMDGPLGKPWS